MYQKNKKNLAAKIDRYALIIIIPSYFILVIGMII
jgi:hypothetical protein